MPCVEFLQVRDRYLNRQRLVIMNSSQLDDRRFLMAVKTVRRSVPKKHIW